MSTELKDKIESDIKRRNFTPQGVFQTIKNSINGIMCYAKDGKSILLYILGVILEIIMGIVYHINGLEWILIVCILGIILSIELLNTGIEAVCDAITKDYNSFIKIAKDCGSGATMIAVLVALILNVIIFLPKILLVFGVVI